MSSQILQLYSIQQAADAIGISRKALYRFYLKRYIPERIGPHPFLTHTQVKAIRAERRQRHKNGKPKLQKAAA